MRAAGHRVPRAPSGCTVEHVVGVVVGDHDFVYETFDELAARGTGTGVTSPTECDEAGGQHGYGHEAASGQTGDVRVELHHLRIRHSVGPTDFVHAGRHRRIGGCADEELDDVGDGDGSAARVHPAGVTMNGKSSTR